MILASLVLATLQSIGGVVPWPAPPPIATNRLLNFFQGLAISTSGDKAAFIVQVPATCTIDKVGFRTGTVTTGGDITVGLYTVDTATGDPTTTLYGGGSTATVTSISTDDNKWFLGDIGNATATQGDVVAAVFAWVSGNQNIAYGDSANWAALLPYTDRLSSSVWTKTPGSPLLTFECTGGVYYPITGVLAAEAMTDRSYNSGSTPDEGGNKITLPFKARVVGAWFYGDTNADQTIKLYDTDGSTVLASFTYDANVQQAATPGIKYVRFSSANVVQANSAYRITMLPSDTTASTLADFDVDDVVGAAMMDAWPGGQNVHYTSRTDAGSWSQTTTRRAMIGLLIDQLDDGAGGGSSKAIPAVISH